MASGRGGFTESSCRGIAFFLAFDPWRTCKCFPPGSARYFDAAETRGLLRSNEAELISHSLVQFGAEISAIYKGSFLPYFSDPRVSTILQHVDDLNHLSESGLAIADSWVDRLMDACPGPVILDKTLKVQSFSPLGIPSALNLYAASPWLAWVEALDFASIGPWWGLMPDQIISIIEGFRSAASNRPFRELGRSESRFGYHVAIPICTRGLQGFVSGIFHDVPKGQREPILNTLLQFGQTIGDVYANLRSHHFYDALDADPDIDQLARELINMISPINRIIVKRGGRRSGYALRYEQGYLAGYRPMGEDEYGTTGALQTFQIAGPYGSEIHVEPICEPASLNAEFTRMRLESYLSHTLGSIVVKPSEASLAYADVQQLRAQFETYRDDRTASVAKLRQFYVVKQVEENWASGAVKITNHELRRFLEHLGRGAKNGYQVTSYKAEFEKIFLGKVSASSTRNALSLSWNTR